MEKRRSALVAGSSRGIGRATALALAPTHDIVLNYRSRRDEAEAAAEALRALGADVLIHQGDITQPDSLLRLTAAALVAFLCSPQADYVTGTSILVDGGFSAGTYWTKYQKASMEKGGWSDRPLGQ